MYTCVAEDPSCLCIGPVLASSGRTGATRPVPVLQHASSLTPGFAAFTCLLQAATCADAKAAGSICSQSKTYGGVSKDSIAISTSFAVDCCVATGVTCAAAKASGQTCPVNYSYDSGQDSHIVGTDFKTDCCKVRHPALDSMSHSIKNGLATVILKLAAIFCTPTSYNSHMARRILVEHGHLLSNAHRPVPGDLSV